MSAPQLTDPGASGEWLLAATERSRLHSSQRRARFARMVRSMMVGLTAFTLLGLVCFAWRRHTLQAALEAPPAAAPVLDAARAQPAALAGPTSSEPLKAAAPSETPAAPMVAPSSTVSARKPASQGAAKHSKKKPARAPLQKSASRKP